MRADCVAHPHSTTIKEAIRRHFQINGYSQLRKSHKITPFDFKFDFVAIKGKERLGIVICPRLNKLKKLEKIAAPLTDGFPLVYIAYRNHPKLGSLLERCRKSSFGILKFESGEITPLLQPHYADLSISEMTGNIGKIIQNMNIAALAGFDFKIFKINEKDFTTVLEMLKSKSAKDRMALSGKMDCLNTLLDSIDIKKIEKLTGYKKTDDKTSIDALEALLKAGDAKISKTALKDLGLIKKIRNNLLPTHAGRKPVPLLRKALRNKSITEEDLTNSDKIKSFEQGLVNLFYTQLDKVRIAITSMKRIQSKSG